VIEKTCLDSKLNMSYSLQILYADDLKLSCEIIKHAYEQLGAEVTVAEDGIQALKALEQRTYDIVLLDIHMPHFNGIEVVQAIRARGDACTIFVGLTADTNDTIETRCIQAGFNRVIHKPATISILRALMDDAQLIETPPEPRGDDSLLTLLEQVDSKKARAFNTRYRTSFSQELKQLREALQVKHRGTQQAALHRLQGLATLKQKPSVLKRLKAISTVISNGEPIATAIHLCNQLDRE
jgi:CheY-like chemotaxis protein